MVLLRRALHHFLKRRTWLNTLGGGFAGNATFLGGYALGAGAADLRAVLLSFAIYLWIPSHIWALAYKYREDYRKAGVPMLPTVVEEKTAAIIIFLLYIASVAYITALYLAFGSGSLGTVLIAARVAATVAPSAYALVKRTDDAMWRMCKASSPVLTLFLLALITNA